MKKQALIITAVIFTLVTITGFASAGYHGGAGKYNRQDCPRFQDGGRGMGMGFRALSPEQQTEVGALHQKFIDDTADTRIALISRHEQMRVLLGTSAPDREQLVGLVQEITDLKSKIMTHRLDFILAAKKVAPEMDFSMNFHGGEKMGRMKGAGKMMGKRGCAGMDWNNCPGQGKGYGAWNTRTTDPSGE